MSDRPIIEVENLGKRYRLGATRGGAGGGGASYQTLRESLSQGARRLLPHRRRADGALPPPDATEFWALRDVSFSVAPGEVVGIIGRNGAGKSTLLKVLSRITDPTEGRVTLRGRVASLLEVGTGFHPELTGRENIFLNGAVLGMHRKEIKAKFDEIVAFAEVERFLDTPVKRYSSGMYVRLAFAVAAHLEPEILIVDEVLAVGDAEFQRKCLGKMNSVAKNDGRSVLFVSHNLASLGTLCQLGNVLDKGRLVFHGDIQQSLNFYQHASSAACATTLVDRRDRQGTGIAKVIKVELIDDTGQTKTVVESGGPFIAVLTVNSTVNLDRVLPGLNFTNNLGQRIATFWGGFTTTFVFLRMGINHVSLKVKRLDLSPGEYNMSVSLGIDNHAIDVVDDFSSINVVAPDSWNPSRYPGIDHGPLFTEFEWSRNCCPED